MDVADEYENLVSNPETLEPAIQTFLEQHSELLPVEPFRLGHGLRFNSFISKFPLDTNLETDFVFLTKDSGTWYAV
jgi:hypothetical protein